MQVSFTTNSNFYFLFGSQTIPRLLRIDHFGKTLHRVQTFRAGPRRVDQEVFTSLTLFFAVAIVILPHRLTVETHLPQIDPGREGT